MPKGKKAEILSHAEKQGESLNKFLNRAVENQITIDNNNNDNQLCSYISINNPARTAESLRCRGEYSKP
ncbi:MAG: hypothetical protein ACI4JM_11865 [Oscillospiraceae bacterium]